MRLRKAADAGRKVRAYLIAGPGGQLRIQLEDGQGLGNSCHDIVDKTLKGPEVGGLSGSWNDDPEDQEFEQEELTGHV